MLRADGSAQLLFCENETNNERLFGAPNASPYVKDGINEFVVHGAADAVNPERTGTKVAAHHVLESRAVTGVDSRTLDRGGWLADGRAGQGKAAGPGLRSRLQNAAQGGRRVLRDGHPPDAAPDGAMVMRQALAGLLWGKQYYEYNVHRWLREHGVDPWASNAPSSGVRNVPWFHMVAGDVISMPDKWEYPWFAAWDLAFHCAPLSLVDVDFAKAQVELLLSTRYLHPNGQVPAYEWNFSDVNPPVTAWAALYVYEREAEIRGEGDREFLARVFDRLLTNFTWWVNRKDADDRNLFQGGLGPGQHRDLRSLLAAARRRHARAGGRHVVDGALLPVDAADRGGALQARSRLCDMALKFATHFEWISIAMNPPDADTVNWDDQDGFYYDVMLMPDGQRSSSRSARSSGCCRCAPRPCSTASCSSATRWWRSASRSSLTRSPTRCRRGAPAGSQPGGPADDVARRRAAAAADPDGDARRGRVPRPARIRAISRRHLEQPCIFDWGGQEYNVHYLPAESDTGMFGGNSNWRGPVWFPMNVVILRGLAQLHRYYGDRVKVECRPAPGTR